MKQTIIYFLVWGLAGPLWAQDASPTPKPPPRPPAKPSPDKTEGNPVSKLFGPEATQSNEPITTEIYSDEAFFDSNKSMGIFSGHVKVVDPRFNLQSDKLTVFISKAQTGSNGQSTASAQNTPSGQGSPNALNSQGGQAAQAGQGQGLERAIAEGNVAVVRDRPDPAGGPPSRAAGRSEKATYVAATGNVELSGTPRVQQGVNTHIATSPDTVMVINQNGQLTTHGPSRTEIRQEPKEGEEGKPGEAKTEKPGETKAEKSKDEKKAEKKDEKKNHKSHSKFLPGQ